MFSKHLSMIIVVMIVSLVLAACGAPPANQGQPPPQPEQQPAQQSSAPTSAPAQESAAEPGITEPEAAQSPPDLAAAAAQLGITEQQLQEALGPPPPDLAAAAAKLGIGEEVLRQALDAAMPGAGNPVPPAEGDATQVQEAQVNSEPTTTSAGEASTAPPAESQPVASGQTNDCPGDHFIDPAGSALEMTITCTDEHIIIDSNNMPNFPVPGTTEPQQNTYYIPRRPQIAGQPSDIPILGSVAVTVNGIQIHGPNGADFDGYPDPIYESMVVECNGHHFNHTIWHFHGRPNCLFSQLLANPNDDRQKVGVVLAYAFDGFPILSPYVCTDAACNSVTKLRSSWQHVADVTNAWEANAYVEGSGDLDRCNGRYAEDGTYAYYATDTFPYFLGCYTGVPETRNPNRILAGGAAPGDQGRPDMQAAADKLGITQQELEQALGPPPPDFTGAAQKLGISEQELRDALGVP